MKQHEDLTANIKILLKTRHCALLRCHQHYLLTNFELLRSGPTLARQVWVANMEMAISIARVAKANFCLQDTLRQLNIPSIVPKTLPHSQSLPPAPTTGLLCMPPNYHQPHQDHTGATITSIDPRIHDMTPPINPQPPRATLPYSPSSYLARRSHGTELPISIQFSTLQMLCNQSIRYPPTSTVSIHKRRMLWYLQV